MIESVPFPESKHRFGDLLLHDGVPNGYRTLRGREVAVFDELQLLVESDFGTFQALVRGAGDDDVAKLIDTFDQTDGTAEDWSTVRWICKACSEARPDDHTHEPRASDGHGVHRIAIAARSETSVRELLAKWERDSGCVVDHVEVLIPPVGVH